MLGYFEVKIYPILYFWAEMYKCIDKVPTSNNAFLKIKIDLLI